MLLFSLKEKKISFVSRFAFGQEWLGLWCKGVQTNYLTICKS